MQVIRLAQTYMDQLNAGIDADKNLFEHVAYLTQSNPEVFYPHPRTVDAVHALLDTYNFGV